MEACEVVYVGDTAEDVIGARGAGLIPILIRRQICGTTPGTSGASESSDPESPGYVAGVDAKVERVSSLGELLLTVKPVHAPSDLVRYRRPAGAQDVWGTRRSTGSRPRLQE